MNTPLPANPSFHARRRQSGGVALVLTLAFLALLSVIVIAFFLNVQTDLQSSNAYSSGVTVKQLSDTTTNLVMGQIADGTRGYEIPGHPAAGTAGAVADRGRRLAWTSQPGLIRTYDDTGLPGRSFKLYSSNHMVTSAGREFDAVSSQAQEVPEDWSEWPALFTDLNRPVVVSETNPDDGQVTSRPSYPIVDPRALGQVEGFAITNAPGAGLRNEAPMPVRWMYVLADGTLTTPRSGKGVASFAGGAPGSIPTKQNPIVGRIAFWTDDETCKLNINTASEGVFWDRPWASGNSELDFARTIPRQNEFNRYNGHPAMTSLSPVFGSIYPVSNHNPGSLDLAPYLGLGVTSRAQGSGLAPRVNVATDIDANGAVKLKSERLYATTDELLYTPVVTGVERTAFEAHKVNREFLEQSKFFLTANSRAPELNMAGKPRVSLWPLQSDAANPGGNADRNAKDRLIAFCTTTSPGTSSESRYYFQRLSKYSGDGHSEYTTPTPSSQHPSSDWTEIRRNRELFAYVQNLTSTSIPGFGGNFLAKWGKDRDQILTSSFDYIRSSLNSYSTALEPKYDYLPTRAGYPHPGETQSIPLTVSSMAPAGVSEESMGFGRNASISEAALVFFIQNDDANDTAGVKDKLQAYLLLEPFNVTPGPAVWSPNLRFVIENLDQLAVTTKVKPEEEGVTTPLGFPAVDRARSLVTSRVGKSGSGHKAAFMGLQALLRVFNDGSGDKNKLPRPATGSFSEVDYYPFISDPVVIPKTSPAGPGVPAQVPKLAFSGGKLAVKIYSGYEAAANQGGTPSLLVQTLYLDFPAIADLPIPTKDADYSTMAKRLDSATDINVLIRPTDVVRSVEASAVGASKGDLRMIAGLKNVSEKFFVRARNYDSPTERFAHSLRTSNGSGQLFLRTSPLASPPPRVAETSLVSGLLANPLVEPVAARGLTAALMAGGLAGDWDNGPGNIEDGAYINKADEGNLASNGTDGGSYFNRGGFSVESGASFSPNRQISSAVSFGSLPVGVKRTRDAQEAGLAEGMPWQTLLSCRYPAAGDRHPGRLVAPRDHLYLDLFTMPIVEPYAISEPFSTAGKVNLNYQIVPFTYIHRSAALRGVLKPVKVTAIPKGDYSKYKTTDGGEYRRALNLEETLRGFEKRFATVAGPESMGDVGAFRSASEICDMALVPETRTGEAALTLEKMTLFWNSHAITGDNARESPYGLIYPRVTTRSNTFTVHMRVQSLRKSVATAADVWDEARDSVLSEYRGSSTLERYVDAGDTKIPDFAVNPAATMDSYYRFRVIGTRKFTP